jgi:THUMP domain-like/RNA cap guanine-N2 methyltransferase
MLNKSRGHTTLMENVSPPRVWRKGKPARQLSSLGDGENVGKTRVRVRRPPQTDEAEICRRLRELREFPEIFEAIARSPAAELALQAELRETYPDDIVPLAIQIAELRRRAASRFARAERMWFDRVGLEQATSEIVARHKARRFSGEIDDLCCGIGGDTIALAESGPVQAVDLRQSRALMTQWNAEIYGVDDRVTTRTSDVTGLAKSRNLVHLDPDRRTAARRAKRLEDYAPGPDFMSALMDARPGGAIKISPASNFGGKFPGCEIELVSLEGECREAVVWFGELAGSRQYRATILPAGASVSGDPLEQQAEVHPLREYLYDPDPAVVRSGMLDEVAVRLQLQRLDEAEEYLTGSRLVDSDFVTPFEVLAELPYNEKQVRRYFREHPYGQVEIKCRHLSMDADKYRRKLSLHGSEPVTLIFARLGGRARAVVGRRV